MLRIIHENVVLGDLTLLMLSGVLFNKDTIAEIYSKQLGIAIEREREIGKRKKLEEQLFRILMIKVAEELTGYQQDLATGRPTDMVFNIADENIGI